MNKAYSLLTDESGSLIVFTLMVLALLTIVGLVSIRTAGTEIEIAGTELRYQRDFYLAEGAAMRAVRRLDSDTDPPPAWMKMDSAILGVGPTDPIDWEAAAPIPCPDLDEDASYIAVYERDTGGNSLDQDKIIKMRDIVIIGRSEKFGEAEVRLGYRMVY